MRKITVPLTFTINSSSLLSSFLKNNFNISSANHNAWDIEMWKFDAIELCWELNKDQLLLNCNFACTSSLQEQFANKNSIILKHAEAYSEPCQTSTMEFFAELTASNR